MTIVTRKIADNHQHQTRQKRNQDRTQLLTDIDASPALTDRELSPQLAAECLKKFNA